MINCNWCCV